MPAKTNSVAKNCHVRDLNGHVRYNMLVDTGEEVIRFSSPGGFLTRDQIRREGWVLTPGHLTRAEMDAERAARDTQKWGQLIAAQ